MPFQARTGLPVLAVLALLGGCATDCASDPSQVSRSCAFRYQLGMNAQMEQHLEDKRAQASALEQEVLVWQEKVQRSEAQLQTVSDQLAAAQASSAESRAEAGKLRAEFALKQQQLQSLKRDLSDLEARVGDLKAAKGDKQETVAQLEVAHADLVEVREQIQSLQTYLEEDLLLRAENALLYE